MASITELAKMYRQRIPTTTTTSKTGPRNTTVEDVRRVATYGRSGQPSQELRYQTVDPRYPSRATTTPTPFQLSPEQASSVQAGIVGGPAAGYGEKYAGFPTQSDYLAAIEGQAFGAYEMANLAQQQANQAAVDRSAKYTAPISTDLSRSASMAGVRPGALMSTEDRAKLFGGYQDVQKFGGGPEYEEARFEQSPDANLMMRMAYESMLEAPSVGQEEQMLTANMALAQGMQSPSLSAYRRFANDPSVYQDVAAPQQIADLIRQTPLYEYARQIAEAQYGMDPAQAAGLFTPAMDMAYKKEQDDFNRSQQGFDNRSVAQYIFDEYGPEQFASYQAKIAEEALYGSPSQQRAAQNAQIEAEEFMDDMTILENYGFRPSDIPGIPAATTRDAFRDENFQDAVDLISAGFAEQGGIPREAAIQIIDNYLASGSPQAPVNAQVLERIISTLNTNTGNFDFE